MLRDESTIYRLLRNSAFSSCVADNTALYKSLIYFNKSILLFTSFSFYLALVFISLCLISLLFISLLFFRELIYLTCN